MTTAGLVCGLRFLDGAIVSFIEDMRVALFYLARGGVGDAQRFLTRSFQWFHPNLNQGLHFHPVAGAVGTDRFLPHFGKKERVVSRTLRALRATPCGRKQGFVLRVERRVGQIEMDVLLDPYAQLADRDIFRFPVLENGRCRFVVRKTLPPGPALVVRLEPGNFKGMRDGEPADVERLLRFLSQVHQAKPSVHIFLRTPDFLRMVSTV